MARKKGESCISILFKMTVLLMVLLAIITTGIFFAYKKLNEFFNRGGTITVPDFRGKHIVDVFKNKPDGLIIVRRDEKYDDRYPKDYVIAQYPEPGTVVRPNKKIQLSISLGAQKVTVPNLVNSNLREVELALLNSQLKIGNKSYMYSNKIIHDRVIAQSPQGGSQYSIGNNVDVLLSLGKKSLILPLPDLTGSTLDEARLKLRAWGFNVGRIYSKQDNSRPKFAVLSTFPAPYTNVKQGDVISILISSGSDKGTATIKDLKKFMIFSSNNKIYSQTDNLNTNKPHEENNPTPPKILIAEDDTADNNIKPITQNTPAVSNEKEISFVMPDGFMPKEVKFIYISRQGRKQIYFGTHKPLDLIKVKVPIEKGGKIQIYINNVPIEERKIEP